MPRQPRSDGFRLTKVGLWFLLFLAIVALAATNTGNNGLYLVLASMVGVGVTSHLLASRNVRGLEISADAGEIFAQTPARLGLTVRHGGRLPRWLLVVALEPTGRPRILPWLLPYLEPGESRRGEVEVLFRRRGRQRLETARVSSLFPLGFFRKSCRYETAVELVVFPQILPAPPRAPTISSRAGDRPRRRPGWGHELHGLRDYRHGDDPRGIHWKQSARTGALIFKERESDDQLRLMIVFDTAVEGAGSRLDPATEELFEQRVREAATAALDFLGRGFEVALLTREKALPFASGPRQRLALLEALALIEPTAAAPPLTAPLGVPHLRFALGGAAQRSPTGAAA